MEEWPKKPKQQGFENTDDSANKTSKNRRKADAYLKYSGMAFQMGIIILLGTYAGQKLDGHFHSKQPYWTIFLALLSIFAALYVVLKDLFNDKKP